MRDTPISPEVQPTATTADPPSESGASDAPSHESHTDPPFARHPEQRNRHTRISGAWAAVSVSLVLGVALIDFIVENTRSVRVEFFSTGGRMPVAVALLAATLAGAAVVLAVGLCRTTQLRLSLRRYRRRPSAKRQSAVQQDAANERLR